jgi:hypothetical protein
MLIDLTGRGKPSFLSSVSGNGPEIVTGLEDDRLSVR